jgi:LacI family transcriptional regulator
MNNITIKDIAKKFKCSPSTVSRALNDHSNINAETKETIQEYAQKMGYQKNSISLSLLNKSTKTIGVLVPSINHSHETLMIQGIQSVFNSLGYMLIFCVTNEKHSLEQDHIKRLLSNRVDAILVSISQETASVRDFSHFDMVNKRKIPLVFIDRDIIENYGSSVVIDDYAGAYLATKHLIERGCRRIAHLAGPKGLLVSKLRLEGYLNCLKNNGITPNNDWIKHVEFNIESAIEPTKKWFEAKNTATPDAIFGVNDYVCYGAINVLTSLDIKIPEEVSVVGFDNCPISPYFSPKLTTIDRKSYEIGRLAAEQTLEMLSSDTYLPEKSILNPILIERESTRQVG